MNSILLKIRLTNGLELDDPFIVASSHLTDSEKAFQNLALIKPAGITTKTISEKYGGNQFTPKPSRILKQIKTWSGNELGLYADGPKETELWGIGIAFDLLKKARIILPDTKIGISILQGENYDLIKKSLNNNYDFVELNLKYSLRLSEDKKKNLLKVIREIRSDITNFCATFKDYPKFIKVSREAYSFFTELFISETLNLIKANSVVVIIANSKKMDGPPSYVQFQKHDLLQKGVIVGDYLFPETYNIIKEFHHIAPNTEIVANGGIMSIGEVLDCMTFGIKSFQICTILHRQGLYSLEMLRRQLKSSIKNSNCKSIQEFSELIVRQPQELAKVSDLFITKNSLLKDIYTSGLSYIKASLLEEVSSQFKLNKIKKTTIYKNDIVFAGTKGSILSYYLSFYLSRYGNYRISIQDSKSILDSNTFDCAIISNAYIKGMKKKNNDFRIQEIGHVKYSLMAITNDFSKINKVFLFKSLGSEEAKIELLKIHKFQYEYIKPEELAPLLIGWDESLAILAKDPLTNFYKYLLPKEVQPDWQDVASVKTPIWLCTKNIPDLIEKVNHDLLTLLKDLDVAIDNYLYNFVNFEFRDYLLELLMDKK
jgi:dihydroorotate dehydrogenase